MKAIEVTPLCKDFLVIMARSDAVKRNGMIPETGRITRGAAMVGQFRISAPMSDQGSGLARCSFRKSCKSLPRASPSNVRRFGASQRQCSACPSVNDKTQPCE